MLTADTSVVVPSLASWHENHEIALEAVQKVKALPAQVVLETASVLSRLPGGLSQPLVMVANLLRTSFSQEPLDLSGREYLSMLEKLSAAGIRGGAIYDAVVAMTAKHHGATLLSLDVRAQAVYASLNVDVRNIP